MASGASWGCDVGVAWSLFWGLALVLAAQEEFTPPPLTYSAKPVRGLVVDAGTGQPLTNVIVVAQWVLHEAGRGTWRRLHVFETTTDATGTYLVPGWEAKPNPVYPWGGLVTRDPALSFFKPGYVPFTVENRFESNEAVRISEWDGKTIKLQKFAGTPDGWARELGFLQTSLAWGDVMDWRSLPRIALALELERLSLAQKKLKVSNISRLSSLGTTIEEVREFLERQK